ncbi:MAG: transcription antitermination factor NusB [Candidatus Poribacteria bacterium]|nr:transcription antitermination factor NusB [Candidatus Poribacteria bacterium]MYK19940.1 transcription antitermination factor NusB [Candidatus Poribacteria bacterium]
MFSRRQSRIAAMQMLYQIQLTETPAQTVIDGFSQRQDTSAEPCSFAVQLVEGTTAHLESIDTLLQNTSKNWKLHRMPIVDLSILRCATYEILYLTDVDPATAINEAVEIAKSYSTPDSPKFINGVLDNIRKKHLNPPNHQNICP